MHCAGHLSFYTPGKKSRFQIPIQPGSTLIDVIKQTGVPIAEVVLAAINDEAVDIDTAIVQLGDKVDLYPPMGGG